MDKDSVNGEGSGLYEYMKDYVQRRTMYEKSDDGEYRNYLKTFGRGNIVTNEKFFSIFLTLTKVQQVLFCEAMNRLRFVSDYEEGFCLEFTYKLFKKHCPNKSSFYKAKKLFIETGLFLKIDEYPNIYIMNMDYLIKGKAKKTELDYVTNKVILNNIATVKKQE